ncbi:MAG TPA: hypothetical protein VGC99_04410 [Candidatus Tectomicrobia bacterium]
MPTDLQEQIATIVRGFGAEIERGLVEWSQARTPDAFRRAEMAIAKASRWATGMICGVLLKHIVGQPEFQANTAVAARRGGQYRSGGTREVKITLFGGYSVKARVAYLKPDRRRVPGPKRRSGRRGKGGAGLYPALAALGVWFGVTPAVADTICHQMTASDSVRAARQALARQDLDLGHKQSLRIFNSVSRRAVAQRDVWLQQMADSPPATGPLRGKRVVVGVDGGRMRLRVPKLGRRCDKTGHHRYDGPWREPKQLVISVIDDMGKIEQTFRPVYDATLGDCNVLFDMLVGYLKALGVHEARALIIVGDGALWIWDRVDDLARRIGVDRDRVSEIVDWPHATSTLHDIVKLCANWSAKQRERWLKRAKSRLYVGDIDALGAMIDKLAVGRRAKKVLSHKPYFTRNAHRMQYDTFKEKGLPLGSGIVESAIRQVVNLRMKGAGKFWDERNAQGMLLLRSYLKAGRYDDLFHWTYAAAVPWWPCGREAAPSPLSNG